MRLDSSVVPKWQTITFAPISSADAGCVGCLLHGRPALVLVLGGVGDGRAVSRGNFDALLAALAGHVGGLLAAAEVEVLG